ncbi:MAG: hypothetical protein J5892_03725 [Bacilli bacterium]|nr:hypothetical protein [Bacilli bacterium]
MNNNEFETLDFNNGDNNTPVVDPNTNVNPAEDLSKTAENIIAEVNQQINTEQPAEAPAPVVEENVVAPQVEVPTVEAPTVAEAAPVSEPAPTPAPAAEPAPAEAAPANAAVADPNAVQEDLSNISYENKDSYNEFANEKPKKKVSITSIIILIILIAGLGGAVYYSIFYKDVFNLNLLGSPEEPLAAKEVTIELGSEIPSDITVYMNRSLSATQYKLTNNKINNNVVGDYSFQVVYNKETYSGIAHVVDTTAPTIETKNVTAQSVDALTADDFVDVCSDLSSCTVDFAESFDITTITEEGTYDVALIAKDSYENSIQVTAKLTISATAEVANKLVCTKTKAPDATDTFSSCEVIYTLSFDDTNSLASASIRKIYTFDDEEKLTEYANTKGTGSSNTTDLTYTINNSVSQANLSTDSSTKSIPTDKTEATTTLTKSGFTCK